MSTVKISEYQGNISGSNINIGATGSFGRLICTTISASTGEFDANTIIIGGTSFNKSNLDDLKAGKSLNASQIEIGGVSFTKDEIERLKEGKTINTTANRLTKRIAIPSRAARPSKGTASSQTMNDIQKVDAIVNNVDDTTFIKTNESGDFDFIVNNTYSFAITTESVDISVPVFLPSITGSTSISGSVEVSGSFTVTDLLNVLADYNQTGSFSISGSTTLAGDVNMDGAVNVQDLLTVLAGFNASGSSTNTGSFSNSGSFSSEGDSTFTGSFGSSGSFDVDGNTTITGSFDQSGSFNSEGSSSFTGSINVTGSRFDIDTSAVIFNSLPTSDPGISGQVFTTGSTGMNLGGITGSGTFRIVCISGG